MDYGTVWEGDIKYGEYIKNPIGECPKCGFQYESDKENEYSEAMLNEALERENT